VAAVICKYIALFVPDLRATEDFYRRIFGKELLFRESDVDGDDGWYTLPPEKGWEDAEMAGIEFAMVALKRDGFVLALFRGAPQHGTVCEICFGLAADEIETVRPRLRDEPISSEHRERWIRFDDPFGFRWTLQEPHVPFRSSGEIAERWLVL
jgi:catechol 2,3-dioxygenase-like lactoylglutathione lyase family enzyme